MTNLSDASIPLAGTDVQVRPYQPADADRWEAFVEACPDATFFHRIGWRAILEEVFKHRTHYLVAERGRDIVGILPLAEVKSRLFGHSLSSLPLCVYGGVASIDPQAIAGLHAQAVKLARELNVGHLELRNRSAREPAWPRQGLYVTFRREIDADDEKNMLAIPRKQRAMVRKGIKSGLVDEIDPGVERFFELFADNMHRHGTPTYSRRYFERLRAEFGDACEALTVLDGTGRPVSGVLSFYFRDEVLPYYAGDVPAARELAANDFKYWALMRRAAGRGARVFDYGRSKRESGSFDFKKNWGFEPQPLHYEYALVRADAVPQNNPNNPKYKALIAAWRRMPRPLADAIGPHIARSLG